MPTLKVLSPENFGWRGEKGPGSISGKRGQAQFPVFTTARAGIHTERVHFAKGANSARIEGRIQGDMTIDYVLGARNGQSVNVSLTTDNGANTFNIIAPGEGGEAMFVGSSAGNQFEGTLPANGDYKVRVYLMRSAACRDGIANYRLEMIID